MFTQRKRAASPSRHPILGLSGKPIAPSTEAAIYLFRSLSFPNRGETFTGVASLKGRRSMSVLTCWRSAVACAALAVLTTTASVAAAPLNVSPGKPVAKTAVLTSVIDASRVPQETYKAISHQPRPMPRPGISPERYLQLKALATLHAPIPHTPPYFLNHGTSFANPDLAFGPRFLGMADSASICPYFGGCQPPDGAIAASKALELEGVNTSFAVYNKTGTLQAGWPKNSTNFFNIPAPSPAGCDPNGAFTSDPRAFFDQNDRRWFVAILEVEGQPRGNACTNTSLYWVAVSKTDNPNGAWFVYAFDMSLGSGNWADYTEIGYDAQQFCFSGNMYPYAGGAFQYAEYFCSNKSQMESGIAPGYSGFTCPSIGGVCLDTVQPVKTLGSVASMPRVEYFVSAENINFGGGFCSGGCSTSAVIDIRDIGGVSIAVIGTPGYSLPPAADQPGCTNCVDTNDPRVAGTPVYRAGSIWTAQNTGVNNGSQIVPGVLWAQFNPQLDVNNNITGGFFIEDNYLYFSGGAAAYFGAIAADDGNSAAMVFNSSSSSYSPGAYVSSHRNSDALSVLNCCRTLQAGLASTFDSRWGDYNSAASNEFFPDNIFIEGEYSTSSGDWGTAVGIIRP